MGPWKFIKEFDVDFIFLGSKITTDGNCSHKTNKQTTTTTTTTKKTIFLIGGKAMTNLDSILKNTDTTFLTKVRLVKAMVFPVVVYGCESWTVKKAEC